MALYDDVAQTLSAAEAAADGFAQRGFRALAVASPDGNGVTGGVIV
jgi:hypothetical protein